MAKEDSSDVAMGQIKDDVIEPLGERNGGLPLSLAQ
ncbi:hypothetical protein SAMN05444678_1413 [Sphingomonas sp. YR710]|nr:hypothetical protein SAMN05444678_1413 [Sphingomonas sp. YR710]